MSSEVDEFDLDIRIHTTHDQRFLRPRPQHDAPDVQAQATEGACGEFTCNTCDGLGCTQTCREATCACDTSETCDQNIDTCSVMGCGIISLHDYCEDETEDTCGCPDEPTAGCPDD